jgi:uncharacterized membrane protein YciS (DUF1049 family)
MVFVFGVDFPLLDFLAILSLANVLNLGLILYAVLELRDEIKKFRLENQVDKARVAEAANSETQTAEKL